MVYNQMSLHEYLDACYRILTGGATRRELSELKRFLTVQICLSHTVRAFSFNVKKHIPRGSRSLVVYGCRIFVNCKTMDEFRDATGNLFVLVCSKTSNDQTMRSKEWIEEKVVTLYEKNSVSTNVDFNEEEEECVDEVPHTYSEDPRNEETFLLRQCKRSKLYQSASATYKDVCRSLKSAKSEFCII